MRVLRDDAELAEATARAADGERRLQDRLHTRAAHEAQAAVEDVGRRALRWPSGLRSAVLPPPRRTPPPEDVVPTGLAHLAGPAAEPAAHSVAAELPGKVAPPAA